VSKVYAVRSIAGLMMLACVSAQSGVAQRQPDPALDSSRARYLDGSNGRDWPGYGRTFGEQHYSPLSQIDEANVGRLGLAWSMDLGPENSVTQPIAVDGVVYFATGYSVVHAVDASSGKLLWVYDPHAAQAAGINLRLAWGSRGIAWWNGKIYTGTQDGRLIAIEAKTGRPAWSVQTFDKNSARAITGAPRVFDGKVVIGHSGDEVKVRGYVTTYDAETGKELWRFYAIPGNPADGFENKVMEMAAKTWAGEWWKYGGGGAVWNSIAYDPDTQTIYFGTGNGAPFNRRVRSADQGDNLFASSIIAVDANTGAYKWHYQVNPGGVWDYDATMDLQLAELVIDGKSRKVLLTAPKNGFFYVIDRADGKLISAEPFAKVTWASRIDLSTGRPIENPEARYPNGTTAVVWPSVAGAHNWLPEAYSPKTKLVYIPVIELGMRMSDANIDLKNFRPPEDRSMASAVNIDVDIKDDPLQGTGALVAWNPVTQKAVWKVLHPTYVDGGVMVTGGNLVFQGTVEGKFSAYDAANGRPLWSFATQAPMIAPPISYLAKGKQYITVLTGLGALSALAGSSIEKYGIDPNSQARRVLTFAIGGKSRLPTAPPVRLDAADDPDFRLDPEAAKAGEAIYARNCMLCHGISVISGTHAPDLRRSTIPQSAEAFAAVVRDGSLVANGMPQFAELTDKQRDDLREYIRTEAHKLRSRQTTG
jgi:quinohemoprotein ethanol dehydrogenase